MKCAKKSLRLPTYLVVKVHFSASSCGRFFFFFWWTDLEGIVRFCQCMDWAGEETGFDDGHWHKSANMSCSGHCDCRKGKGCKGCMSQSRCRSLGRLWYQGQGLGVCRWCWRCAGVFVRGSVVEWPRVFAYRSWSNSISCCSLLLFKSMLNDQIYHCEDVLTEPWDVCEMEKMPHAL